MKPLSFLTQVGFLLWANAAVTCATVSLWNILSLTVCVGLCVRENCVMTQFTHKGMCPLTLIYPLYHCILPAVQGRSSPSQYVLLWANEHSVLSHIKSAPLVLPVFLVSAFVSVNRKLFFFTNKRDLIDLIICIIVVMFPLSAHPMEVSTHFFGRP